MKRILAAVAGLSLLSLGVRADEEKETKTEVKRDSKSVSAKTMKKHKHGKTTNTASAKHEMKRDSSGGSTEKTEMKSEHDAPGMDHDRKTEMKETVKRDAQGNVIKDEKKEEAK